MALKEIRRSIEVEKLAGEAAFQLPVRAEALVPGAGRESVAVLMADGYAVVSGAEAQNDRAVVSGAVFCQAAYRMGGESGARALTAQAPFEQIVEIEGIQPRMSVAAEAQTDHVEAVYESGHMVFYVTVTVRVRICSLDTVEAVADVEGVEGLRRKTEEICSAKLNAEAADAVELNDQVSLPSVLNARTVLMQWASPMIGRVERDLGGVRVSGEVKAEALIAGGVRARPVALIRYQMPFERLISLPDWISGEPEARADVSELRLEVEEGGEGNDSALKLHCRLTLSVRMNGKDCATVLTDVYSTGETAVEGVSERLALCGGVRRCAGQEGFRSTLLLPEGAPGVGVVLAVRVNPVVSGWKEENGRPTAEGVLEATVLYMQAGEETLSSAQAELPFEMGLDCLPGKDAWMTVRASDAEAAAIMSDRLELKCVLRASSVERVTEEKAVLTGVRETEAAAPVPGIGICYPQPGDTLWSVGKRYRISEESLSRTNGGVREAGAGTPLLIVRGVSRAE